MYLSFVVSFVAASALAGLPPPNQKSVLPPTCSVVRVSPAPPNSPCGTFGKLQQRDVIFRTHISSSSNPLNTCRDMCMADNHCKSFAYKSSNQMCRAFSSKLSQQGFHPTQNSNGNIFYSRECFKTVCSKPSNPSKCFAAALATPTPVTEYSNGVSTKSQKSGDSIDVPLPFPIGYGVYRSNRATMFVNGYLWTTDSNPGEEFVWLPFDQAMQIDFGKDQGMFYEIDGEAPNRSVKFEWRTTNSNPGGFGIEQYDFVVQLFENDPYKATYSYLKISDTGIGAYSGLQDETGDYDYSPYIPNRLATGLTLNVQNQAGTFDINHKPLCT